MAQKINKSDKIWFDEKLFRDTARKVGLKDYDCYDIFSLQDSPLSNALYISTDKSQWESFREAFAYCMIRKHFIQQMLIMPNQKLLSQHKWAENDYAWVNEIYFIENITYSDGKIACAVSPHKIDIREFNIEAEFNLRFTDDRPLADDEYRANKEDINLMIESVKDGYFLSLYQDDYTYLQLFFGETESKYILIETALID
jgi:hypothetical protein